MGRKQSFQDVRSQAGAWERGAMWGLVIVAVLFGLFIQSTTASAQDLEKKDVLRAIEHAKRFLISQQNPDGSWQQGQQLGDYQVGVSALALLSLLNAGMTVDDTAVAKGLRYLRSVKEPQPDRTYEISLMIMALAAAKDGNRDKTRIVMLAHRLEDGQVQHGPNAGMWSYYVSPQRMDTSGDHSNTQFAVLGLRDAALAGIPVERDVWTRIRQHWLDSQTPDGGWGYSRTHNQGATGSMTVAGIASLIITSLMLADDSNVNPDGTVNCCAQDPPDPAIERGIGWMERHFAVGHNPAGGAWLLYYIYGLERAGRLSGRRFFGDHDWYREGAQYLIANQTQRTGEWQGTSTEPPVVATSFALLFLSKGLCPVLINKLQYSNQIAENAKAGVTSPPRWDLHPNDVRNLTDHITGLPKWPKLLTWQVADIGKISKRGGVADLLQSPILYLTGDEKLDLPEPHVELLREYVNNGGFLFAVNGCNSVAFDESFRELIRRMYPDGMAELKPLPPEHFIFRSEYLLDPSSVELLGVDFGCRTSVVYSPNDIACLWNKWATQDPPKRSAQLKAMITKATRIGVNVVAYATGRQPPDKLEQQDLVEQEGAHDTVERGLLQIAKIRHNGNWDAAPQALRNLLLALNRTVGLAACTRQENLLASDPNVFNYPILYMQGQRQFELSEREGDQLRKYITQNGVLFANACCGAPQFDRSFRQLMKQLFPGQSLEPIPPDHEMFTVKVGHDLSNVKRRAPEANNPNLKLNTFIQTGKPLLEGINWDGRYAVIYSKYDISCALERQSSVACAGYVPEDAVKIAVNVVLYAMMQDASMPVSGR